MDEHKLQQAFNQAYSLRGSADGLADKLIAGLKKKDSELYKAYSAGVQRFDLDMKMGRIKDDPDRDIEPDIEPDSFEDINLE